MECERYAIWWVPNPETALGRFGAEWTGWCADRGVAVTRRAPLDLSHPGIADAMHLRGLHASIGACFRPASGRSAWALGGALAALADRTAPIRLSRLRADVSGDRVVLIPPRPDVAIAQLLAAATDAIRPFRIAAEFATLKCTDSDPEGKLCLKDAGGPSMDAATPQQAPMRFQLPLTDGIADAREVAERVASALEPVLARSMQITDIALAGDPGGGRPWRLLERFPLDGDRAGITTRLPDGMDCCGPRLLTPLIA